MNVLVTSLVIVTKWKVPVTETINALIVLGVGYLACSGDTQSMLLLYAFSLLFSIRSHIASM